MKNMRTRLHLADKGHQVGNEDCLICGASLTNKVYYAVRVKDLEGPNGPLFPGARPVSGIDAECFSIYQVLLYRHGYLVDADIEAWCSTVPIRRDFLQALVRWFGKP